MTHSFGMLLKSFDQDLEYARRCINSFNENNAAGIDLYLMVPDEDLALFASLAGGHVQLLSDSPLEKYFTSDSVNGMRPGYINQEIVKLAFWELGLLSNYLCVDSDAIFIRPIKVSDYMADDTTPYSVLVEDKDLHIQPRYFEEHWKAREEALKRIQQSIGFTDQVFRTCHGHQVMSSKVLSDFRENFLNARGWTYLDALAIAPYEFTWYNLWLQKSQVIPVVSREPFAKVFHNEDQHLDAILRGMTVEDISRAYPLLVVNSNYSRDLGVIDPAASKPDLLSHYLSYGELGQLLRSKLRDSWSRLSNRSRKS
jgi:hypothetical protein